MAMTGGPGEAFSILDYSPIGHFVLDQELKIRFWNRCLELWTGLSRQEVVGFPLAARFPHLATPKYHNRITAILQGGPPTTFSSQLHRYFLPSPLPGGKQRVQHTIATPLATNDPQRFLALFSIQDVTNLTEAIDQHSEALKCLTAVVAEREKEVRRRQEVEETLREMDRMKNDFIASAAHELNTPLATIQGYAELLKELGDRFDATRKAEFVDEIIDGAQGLSHIIDDLLDIARFERGRGIHLDKSRLDPNEVVGKIIRNFEDCHVRRTFRVDLSPADGRTVPIDPMRIRQVLENIFSNSIKYSAPETTITVRSSWRAEGFYLVIADQGIGMNEKQVAKVFDKFFRVDVSDTATRGLGLGMSIVKQIVDQHDGNISIVSSPGQGTTVTLFLPD